jgi:hypothetical protein
MRYRLWKLRGSHLDLAAVVLDAGVVITNGTLVWALIQTIGTPGASAGPSGLEWFFLAGSVTLTVGLVWQAALTIKDLPEAEEEVAHNGENGSEVPPGIRFK